MNAGEGVDERGDTLLQRKAPDVEHEDAIARSERAAKDVAAKSRMERGGIDAPAPHLDRAYPPRHECRRDYVARRLGQCAGR